MSLGATTGRGGVQDPVQQRAPSPQLPADHVLNSGAVLFPGVFDQYGCPLVLFPVESQIKLSELSTAEVLDFITYCKCLHSKKQEKQSLVSVVADLRDASLPTTKFIAETLLLLEQHMRTVHSVYIIWPKKKAVKLWLKLLNPSKSYTIPFRMILLKEVPELYNYIDRSQLPASLGGYFMYCHQNWGRFIKEIHAFVQDFLSVLQRLPSFISSLQAQSRLPLPSTLSELQHFCSTNKAEFLQLRRELGLDELLRHSEAVVDKLRYPDRDPCYQAMAGTAIFTQTAFDMLQNHSRITAAVEKVEVLWQQAFSKAHLQLQLVQLHGDALQVTEDIETHREKLQLFSAETVKDSAKTATVLSEFETNIYNPAMVLIQQAEHVIHMLEEIFPLEVQTREYWVLDLNSLKENLYSEVHFILQTLRAVSSYHHCYSKVSSWNRLVLCENFLQELLSGLHRNPPSSQKGTVPAWRRKLSSFLKKNPSPDMEELLHLAQLSSTVPDDELQQAGRQVSQRCLILRELLISSGPVSVEQLQLALQWQHELLHSSRGRLFSDDASNNSPADAEHGSSERRHAECDDTTKGLALPAASPAASEVSADGTPSLVTSRSGFDGTRSSPEVSAGNQESGRTALGEEDQHRREELDQRSVGNQSARISTTVQVESLNVIQVKRSAAAPDNPWLSLPVDDLESSYTVIITSKPTPHQTDLQVLEASGHHAVDPTHRSTDQHLHTEATEPQTVDWNLHPQTDVSDPELSLVHNVLSGTNNVVRNGSICSTDPEDSCYHQPSAVDGVLDVSLKDWEVTEQESLREVERILHRADVILKEEENVLAQEAELDVLLVQDEKDVWWLRDKEDKLDWSSSEQSEAGVGPEDYLHPAEPAGLSELSPDESAGRSEELHGEAAQHTYHTEHFKSKSELRLAEELSSCQSSDDSEDDLTEPEPLHPDVWDLVPSSTGPVSAESTTSDLSTSFVLNPNVKEHHNNNNNVSLSDSWAGSSKNCFEMSEDEADPLEPARVRLTEETVPSNPQKPPHQLLEFYPGGANEEDEDGSVRMSDCGSDRMQTQLSAAVTEITDFRTPVVFDTGSGLMKAGFADQELPNIVFPNIVGVPKYEEIMNGSLEREMYIGHDAQQMRGVLALKHPIKNGIITSWDDMEKIWHHTFQHLAVDPEEHPVLLTEAAMNPLENRQRMVQIMFESFNVPFTYVAVQAVLALYAAGRTTGVVCDSGDGVTHSVPVFEGYCLPHAVQRFPLAGADVTMYLKKLLQEQGVCMRTTAEEEIVREMKEKCCCVALNYEAELSRGPLSCKQMQYFLPDGQVVTLETERFRAPEILFKPELIGRDHYGMHESVYKAIASSDMDLRRGLLGNIVLSGGNTLLPGFPERLQAEIKGLVPAGAGSPVSVSSPKGRDFLVWSGGAVLASMPTFSSAWISQEEYEEYGPQIVFRKCF